MTKLKERHGCRSDQSEKKSSTTPKIRQGTSAAKLGINPHCFSIFASISSSEWRKSRRRRCDLMLTSERGENYSIRPKMQGLAVACLVLLLGLAIPPGIKGECPNQKLCDQAYKQLCEGTRSTPLQTPRESVPIDICAVLDLICTFIVCEIVDGTLSLSGRKWT